jgi:SAM-dependent methyltransferase
LAASRIDREPRNDKDTIMNDWTYGYVADIGYTFGYYTELNPLRMRLAFLNAGIATPQVVTACELGFGQGMSANVHAAGSTVQWWGTDFNPAQASFAQELAVVSRAEVRLFDQAFAEFCRRGDLPDFDYIGLHGIWSWISDDNRAAIVDFIARKLKVGGALYISYNTMPGWAAFAPMRHLMTEHAEVMAAPGRGIVSRIDAAIEFAEKLLATKPLYARANPQAAERIKKIKDQNRHYLAHEYFNRDWDPMPFADMARWLERAKLNYACSAHYLDHIDAMNLSADQQAFLKDVPDPMFRETTRDFMVNQQFRRDYWVRGARRLSGLAQAEMLRREKFILVTPRGEVSLKAAGSLGEATLQEPVYGPVLDALADHHAKTLAQIEQAVQPKGVNFAQVLQAVMVLTGAGHLSPAQEEAVVLKAKRQTERLNAHLIDKARGSGDIAYLASPVTGGGVAVPRFHQLFLLARSQGKKQPAEWAQFAWQILSTQGQRIVKEGKRLEFPEDNMAELTHQANEFSEKRLSILRALDIA